MIPSLDVDEYEEVRKTPRSVNAIQICLGCWDHVVDPQPRPAPPPPSPFAPVGACPPRFNCSAAPFGFGPESLAHVTPKDSQADQEAETLVREGVSMARGVE